jgi:hypothetical protein
LNDYKSGLAFDIQPVSSEKAQRVKRQESNVHPHVVQKRKISVQFKGDYLISDDLPKFKTLNK